MSRRSPPPGDADAYASSFGAAGFISVAQTQGTVEGSYEDGYTEEDGTYHPAPVPRSGPSMPPSYISNERDAPPSSSSSRARGPRPLSSSSRPPASQLAPHASPFARPDPPDEGEGEFHWTDDNASTIRPDDSVSQLNRKFTGQKRAMGPRPLLGGPIAEEEDAPPSDGYGWVEPEALPSPTGPVPRQAPSGPYGQSERGYYRREEEEEEDPVMAYESSRDLRDSMHSSADLPLVANSAPVAGFDEEQERRSNVKAYPGYAAVAGTEGQEDDYSPYARRRGEDVESGTPSSATLAGSGNGIRMSASENGGFMSYVKSFRSPSSTLRGSEFGDSKKRDSYGMDAYPPSQQEQGFMGPTDFGSSRFSKDIDDTPLKGVRPLYERWFYDRTDNAIRIDEHKRGVGIQKYPVACWTLSVIMAAVLIYELVKMKSLTGSYIQTKPSFNVMIGPSGSVLINLGARFAGCMKFIAGVSDIDWICLADSNKSSVLSSQATCSMAQVCGFGGFPKEAPNQTFRFFIPIFIHAGIIHLVLNLLAQLVSAAQVERMMGTPKFLVLYLASGTFGFVLGANFSLVGQPSVGASGAIFGTHAAILVDLLSHWDIEYRPVRKLLFLFLEIVIGLALGLVPGVDNFAHIGGFCVGLLGSIVFFPVIHQTQRHRYVLMALRLIALPLIVVIFVVLIRNFAVNDPASACSWCRYLSCWPTARNNHCKGTGLETISSSSSFFSIQSFITLLLPVVLPFL